MRGQVSVYEKSRYLGECAFVCYNMDMVCVLVSGTSGCFCVSNKEGITVESVLNTDACTMRRVIGSDVAHLNALFAPRYMFKSNREAKNA